MKPGLWPDVLSGIHGWNGCVGPAALLFHYYHRHPGRWPGLSHSAPLARHHLPLVGAGNRSTASASPRGKSVNARPQGRSPFRVHRRPFAAPPSAPPCLRVRLPPSRHGTGAEMTCRPGGSSNASPPFSGLRCFTPARAANGLPPQVTGDPGLVGIRTLAVVFGGISNS